LAAEKLALAGVDANLRTAYCGHENPMAGDRFWLGLAGPTFEEPKKTGDRCGPRNI